MLSHYKLMYYCVWEKRDQNVFGTIFYKTQASLMKFGIQFPE